MRKVMHVAHTGAHGPAPAPSPTRQSASTRSPAPESAELRAAGRQHQKGRLKAPRGVLSTVCWTATAVHVIVGIRRFDPSRDHRSLRNSEAVASLAKQLLCLIHKYVHISCGAARPAAPGTGVRKPSDSVLHSPTPGKDD